MDELICFAPCQVANRRRRRPRLLTSSHNTLDASFHRLIDRHDSELITQSAVGGRRGPTSKVEFSVSDRDSFIFKLEQTTLFIL